MLAVSFLGLSICLKSHQDKSTTLGKNQEIKSLSGQSFKKSSILNFQKFQFQIIKYITCLVIRVIVFILLFPPGGQFRIKHELATVIKLRVKIIVTKSLIEICFIKSIFLEKIKPKSYLLFRVMYPPNQ